MPRILSPLPSLQLDPRNTDALLNAMQTRIFLESGGALNDFSASSPLAALTEGQVFASSELLYYLNSLPEAFAIQWMRLLGVQRVIGATAHVEVFFSKVPSYNRVVVISRGTELFTSRGLKFILTEDVTIDRFETIGSGIAVSEKWGTIYNIPPRSITTINNAITGLDLVYNLAAGKGGEDTETVAEMKSRAFAVLRRRSLITVEDYTNEIYNILPQLDMVEYLPSSVLNNDEEASPNQMLFVLGYDSASIVETQIKTSILDLLRQKSPIGVGISLTEPYYVPLAVSVTVEYNSRNSNSLSVANGIRDALVSELTPSRYGLGALLTSETGLNEIFFTAGVSSVPRYELRVLELQGEDPHLHVGECDPLFKSAIDIETGECVRTPRAILSSDEEAVYQLNLLETPKIYQLEVVTIDLSGNALIYSYDELYAITF